MAKEGTRVVVTGLGVMSPLGETVDEFWDGLSSGRSGIGKITQCDTDGFPGDIAGEVTGFDAGQYANPKETRRMARFSQFAVAAASTAIEDSGIDVSHNNDRIGVVMGNGNGGFPTTEDNAKILFEKGGMRVSPFFIPMILPNMAAAQVSRIFNLTGYTSTVITACAAGNQAIGEAYEAIRRGAADVIVAGGCEAGISRIGLGGFHVIRALSRYEGDPKSASKPFDSNRDGFVPAEGAGVLVIESLEHAIARGAEIKGEIIGYAVSSDAYHAVQPDENGEGAARAIKWAIKNAGKRFSDIDYINAHGTSTPFNDRNETAAIRSLFQSHAEILKVSSTKSMTGHLLGAAGGIEAVITVKAIMNQLLPPTINYETPDPECTLDYVPNTALSHTIKAALSNTFGFGGHNAVLCFQTYN